MAIRLPRTSFSWKPTISGREQWRWGLWLIEPSKSGRRPKLRIMVRGLLLWLGSLMALVYLALASAWFMVLDRRPHNLVTWTDCVLAPVRWAEISRKRGDAYITEGLAALEAMNWSEAVLKIQAGLARSPDHRNGREKLALFYVAAGQRERGLQLMLEGIERAYPGREQVETFLRICLTGEDYGTALKGLDASLAGASGAVDRDRVWLIEQKARALMVSERFEEAVGWVNRQDAPTEVLRESRVVSLIELERYDEAAAALTDWEAVQGKGGGGTLRIGVRLARERKDFEAMRSLLAVMCERSPRDPNPWIYSVVQSFLIGDVSEARKAMEIVFMRFETGDGVLYRLAQPLVEIEAWDLFDEVNARARSLSQTSTQWGQLRVEAAIKRGRFDEALALIETLNFDPDGGERETQAFEYWKNVSLAYASHLASGEPAPGEELLQTLRRAPVNLQYLKKMAKRLESAERVPVALSIWELARARFPGSEQTQDEVKRLQSLVAAADRIDVAVPLVQDGTPIDLEQSELLASAEPVNGNAEVMKSPRLFLAQCDRLIETKDWNRLETLFRDFRRARPTWSNANATELLNREIELNIGLKHWAALLSNVRFRLDGTLPRALEIMNLVRRLDLMGERDAAELVLAEVDRRNADFPPARRQREDWAKAKAAAEEAAAKASAPTP